MIRAAAHPYPAAFAVSTVVRHLLNLQPHRVRTFKRSADPAFAEKVEDIVGLYMDPPRHAVVLSVDEKSQSRPWNAPAPIDRSLQDGRRPALTTTFVTAQRRCLPRSTCWRGP